jgi:hypothetical protein
MDIGKGACTVSRGSFPAIMLATAMAAALSVSVWKPTHDYNMYSAGRDPKEIERARKKNRRAKIARRNKK